MTDAELAEARELCDPNNDRTFTIGNALQLRDVTVPRLLDELQHQDGEIKKLSTSMAAMANELVQLRSELSQAVAACQVLSSQLAAQVPLVNAVDTYATVSSGTGYGALAIRDAEDVLRLVHANYRYWLASQRPTTTSSAVSSIGTVSFRDGKLVGGEEK